MNSELFWCIWPLIVSLSVSTGLANPGPGAAEKINHFLLEKEYDLLPRLEKGDKSYYSYVDRFGHVGSSGREERSERVTGYFRQEVVGFRPSGAPVFRVVRNKTRFTAESTKQDPVGPLPLDFGEGIEYEICFEDDFDYLPIDTSRLPNSMHGFMMFENIVHSHHFATLATQAHGALGQLKRIGMTVTIPDSGKTGRVHFPGFLTITLVRGRSTMSFLGLSKYQDQPAALLSYDIPLHFPEISGAAGTGTGTGRATGLIWISLGQGEILRGYLRQTTTMVLQGADGSSTPGYVETEGWLEKISREEYPGKDQVNSERR